VKEFGQDFQAGGFGVEPELLGSGGRFMEDDILFEAGFGVGIADIRFEAGERVGINDLIGEMNFAARILDLGQECALAGGGVEVTEAKEMSAERWLVRANDFDGIDGIEIGFEDDLMGALAGDTETVDEFDDFLGLPPTLSIPVMRAVLQLNVGGEVGICLGSWQEVQIRWVDLDDAVMGAARGLLVVERGFGWKRGLIWWGGGPAERLAGEPKGQPKKQSGSFHYNTSFMIQKWTGELSKEPTRPQFCMGEKENKEIALSDRAIAYLNATYRDIMQMVREEDGQRSGPYQEVRREKMGGAGSGLR
jgi:hypothetical protein